MIVTTARRILLIDGDDLVRHALAEQMAGQEDIGVVVEAASGAAGLVAARQQGPFAVVLLAATLPDMDGVETCRALRAAGVHGPIIMLTDAAGTGTGSDTAAGLAAGASDHIAKPFRLAVLLARIRAHLHRHGQADDAAATIGPYRFVPAAKLLHDTRHGRTIRLTEKEAAILSYLLRAGAVVDRDTLLEAVWGYAAGVTTHTLETHVYRLRQKIEPEAGRITLLLTEAGGYRLAV